MVPKVLEATDEIVPTTYATDIGARQRAMPPMQQQDDVIARRPRQEQPQRRPVPIGTGERRLPMVNWPKAA